MASRPTNGAGYDKSLLADAPAITKKDKQAGYNIDLLEQGRRPAAAPVTPTHQPPSSTSLPEKGLSSAPPSKESGAKSRKTRVIIFVVLIVALLAVALGAGLGAGLKKKKNDVPVSGTNLSTEDQILPTGSHSSSGPASLSSAINGSNGGGGGAPADPNASSPVNTVTANQPVQSTTGGNESSNPNTPGEGSNPDPAPPPST